MQLAMNIILKIEIFLIDITLQRLLITSKVTYEITSWIDNYLTRLDCAKGICNLLNGIRLSNKADLILRYLNINSIRNKI